MKTIALIVSILLLNINTLSDPPIMYSNNDTVNTHEQTEQIINLNYINNMKYNNPLNIRRSDANNWLGKVYDNTGAFEQFTSIEYGIRAGMKLLKNYQNKYGLHTVKDIISKYAPINENDTEGYIHFVSARLKVRPDDIIDLNNKETLECMIKAMMIMESGYQPTDLIMTRAWRTLLK